MRTFKASAVALCLDTVPTDAALEECPSQRGSFLTAVLQSMGDRGFLFFFVQNSQEHVQTSWFCILCGGVFILPYTSSCTVGKMLIYSLEQGRDLKFPSSYEGDCSRWAAVWAAHFLLPWVLKDFFCLPKEAAPFGEAVRKGSVCLTVWGNWFPLAQSAFGHYCKIVFVPLYSIKCRYDLSSESPMI